MSTLVMSTLLTKYKTVQPIPLVLANNMGKQDHLTGHEQ